MGSSWSRWMEATSSREGAVISERDVLTLCEDGDLLLAREQISHAQLGVAIDACVARDISMMQRGDFPTRRLTALPPWTSCALFVRRSGALHVLEIDVDGMRLALFADRVAARHDVARRHRYAVRRLQHVRDERSAAFFRQLSFELATVLPLRWRHLRDPHARPDSELDSASTPVNLHTRLPSTHARETLRETLRGAPLLNGVLRRTLESSVPSQEPAEPEPPSRDVTPPWRQQQQQPRQGVSALESFLMSQDNVLRVDVGALLATALVVAVYEHLGIIPRVGSDQLGPAPSGLELLPSSLWSREEPATRRLRIEPADALGLEMALV
ncbi:hypothetical protein P43SY_003460 [Pythium insidiosum]|uniref:Uncharacterized protein n=1 Tax=Pythium insidiosum TaxID=114742 RepID=A0AAD5LX39_PYTIN|nr:hypothetical protein P43SY_003460 [Pythium insidiosum]